MLTKLQNEAYKAIEQHNYYYYCALNNTRPSFQSLMNYKFFESYHLLNFTVIFLLPNGFFYQYL